MSKVWVWVFHPIVMIRYRLAVRKAGRLLQKILLRAIKEVREEQMVNQQMKWGRN